MTPRTAAILCYIPVVGWVAAIVVLASQTFRNQRWVRFHAFQGLYLFVAWLIVHEAIGGVLGTFGAPFGRFDHVLEALLIGIWIFMILKVSNEENYSLPVIGELAERSINER